MEGISPFTRVNIPQVILLYLGIFDSSQEP